jgi:hypothetical protein
MLQVVRHVPFFPGKKIRINVSQVNGLYGWKGLIGSGMFRTATGTGQ